MKHLRCKHVAALLLAVLSLKSYTKRLAPKNKSINLQRANIKRFVNCSNSVRDAVDCDLTWTDILENMLLEPDKKRPGASNNDKFLTTPKQPKAKQKKHYATLEDTPVKQLQATLRSIDPNLKTTGKKQELIERIIRHRPIAPSASVQGADAQPGLAALDFVAKSNKTKRASDRDEPKITKKQRTTREIEALTLGTARIMGGLKDTRERKVSSRLTFPNL